MFFQKGHELAPAGAVPDLLCVADHKPRPPATAAVEVFGLNPPTGAAVHRRRWSLQILAGGVCLPPRLDRPWPSVTVAGHRCGPCSRRSASHCRRAVSIAPSAACSSRNAATCSAVHAGTDRGG
jgi:hypothetical protein